jgi:YafQ family addiction module toxin component
MGEIIIDNIDNSQENLKISDSYSNELDQIREQLKNGHCHTLNECLLLFEELWEEQQQYEIILSNHFQREMDKLSKKDPEQFRYVLKKIDQIKNYPTHYKPLSGDMYGARRAHIGDFVLIFEIEDKKLVFIDYNHHDKIYM